MKKLKDGVKGMLLMLLLFILGFIIYSLGIRHITPPLHFQAVVHPTTNIYSMPKLRILIGVFSMASKFERRNLVRTAYHIQSMSDAEVTLKFVLGRLRNEEERALIGVEMLHFQDIIILDCEENVNHGKTYHYFYSVAKMGLQHDYVMKVDDDSYVRVANLVRSLQELPKNDLYYGYVLPCENTDPYKNYMAGMGYIISWDLVEWIANSSIALNNMIGTEDRLVGNWLDEGGKAKTRVSKKPLFYDHPDSGGKCAHDIIPDTILIHQLKSNQKWSQVLTFFEHHRFSVLPSVASKNGSLSS